MPRFGPIKRAELIRYLRRVGFQGPSAGGKHQFMVCGDVVLRVPNPHQGDISTGLLARVLREAGIARDEWEVL
ncbi:MAG: type II toxin-antitoxin system HicA family toxin [Chloroflexi bacterium]|nr:type II toxin-antitoxin system HicA family toxin [Chloroflexota bacterium]